MLLAKQQLFASLLPRLIDHARELGYEVTLGEAWRPEFTATEYARRHIGIKLSLHRDRLAIDLNLFRAGIYLTDGSDYAALGHWWEQQSATGYECCWGGHFADGNHFSIKHEGRQ